MSDVQFVPQAYPLAAVWITVDPGEMDSYSTPEGPFSIKDHAAKTDDYLRTLITGDLVAFWQVGSEAVPVTVNGAVLGPERHVRCCLPEAVFEVEQDHLRWLIKGRDRAVERCAAMGWTPTGWSAPTADGCVAGDR